MLSLSGQRLRWLQDHFLDAGKHCPNLWHVAFRPQDPLTLQLWPHMSHDYDVGCLSEGLSRTHWREVLWALSPGADRPWPLSSHWLLFDGELWQGAFYSKRAADRCDSGPAKDDTEGLAKFRELAGMIEKEYRLPPAPDPAELGFTEIERDGAYPWIVAIYQAHLFETAGDSSLHVRYMSQNVFYTSAQAIDKLNSDQSCHGDELEARRNDRSEGRSPPASASNYLVGRDLSEALEVAPSRHKAFHKSLERLRLQKKITCWKEIERRKGNSATFTYDANAPEIRDMAARYRESKSR